MTGELLFVLVIVIVVVIVVAIMQISKHRHRIKRVILDRLNINSEGEQRNPDEPEQSLTESEPRDLAAEKKSKAELARLATWIDASGVFYGSYWGRRDERFKDHPNFRPVPTFEQAISRVNPTPVEKR